MGQSSPTTTSVYLQYSLKDLHEDYDRVWEQNETTETRIKKARKESGKKKRPTNPPQITGFWGRGASLYRPGLFTKKYFVKHGEACAADIYYDLSREIERLNKERIEIGEKPFQRPNYSSFAKYFH